MSETTPSGNRTGATGPPRVPSPKPPDDPDAWYAEEVRAQYELHPDVVATVVETDDGFDYRVREPVLSPAGRDALDRVESHFGDANLARPLTREGANERMTAGFDPKYRRIVDRLTDLPPGARRRVEYYALRNLRCLGALTPLALDDDIEVADAAGETLVVHTDDYAPADTRVPTDADYLERFASERVETHIVEFREFRIPVVIYREHLLANDSFTTKYAVQEPDLLPGDEALIEECKDRIWETNVDGVVEDRAGFVRERARTFLSRRLTARNTRAWVDAVTYRARTALAEYDLAVPPVDHRFSTDRLSDLVYYVMRDFVGHGKLTIPIRDDLLEDVEANRVGERIKVVPRGRAIGHGERVPTNLTFEDEAAFANVVTGMAASDGTELNASNPSAKVNLRPDGVPGGTTIRAAVALGVISEDGPHISIRKQAPEAMTPVDLLDSNSLSTEIVTLLWQAYEHHGVVLFAGPTGVGKTTLMNAHMPFIPYRDRPISIDEGSREVRLPHETGVSLTTRDHESDYKRVTMADLMTECNYLNPDVEVIAEINTPASFRTFAESLNTGHGIVGTTHAEDVEKLVNRVVEQDLPLHLLREIDLVVFPRKVDGDRYVGEVVELLSQSEYEELAGSGANAAETSSARRGAIQKDDATVYWNTVARRDTDGEYRMAYDHPRLSDGEGSERGTDLRHRFFHRLAERTDRSVEEVENEFHRKHGYVQYLEQEGTDDFADLFEFLSDLQTNEAATVERAKRGEV
ncbi:type II/IV secretion system ATPase subunit [Halorussus litoreus]|uniref:type II/IV secretion system ATPase subunit n=1 Tax=Halorussus litoreus TaxID=1710536 RepID=UPI000E28256B|nr:type II/IV secretion system ATPase subunit [Halorussus litoreus]